MWFSRTGRADLFFVTLRHHGFVIRTASADLSSRFFLSLVFFLAGDDVRRTSLIAI
jgi:hypothetical protein